MKMLLVSLLTLLLSACGKNTSVAYDCEGNGLLMSDTELKWAFYTFKFSQIEGVWRVYEEEGFLAVFDPITYRLTLRYKDPQLKFAQKQYSCVKK